MKHITLLHTVASVYSSYPEMLKEAFEGDVEVTSLVDEFLVTNARKKGYFPSENRKKLLLDLMSAEAEGPDLIIVTCSSLTPFAGEYRNVIKTPIVLIDTNMCKTAAEKGKRIAVLATAPTTVDPTVSLIKSEAGKIGKEVTVDAFLDESAMDALKKGDVKKHDEILDCLATEKCKGYDVIVLAQASMATAASLVSKSVKNAIVLTSPGSSIEEAKEILK